MIIIFTLKEIYNNEGLHALLTTFFVTVFLYSNSIGGMICILPLLFFKNSWSRIKPTAVFLDKNFCDIYTYANAEVYLFLYLFSSLVLFEKKYIFYFSCYKMHIMIFYLIQTFISFLFRLYL